MSSSRSSKSSKKTKGNTTTTPRVWQVETDDRVRGCKVYLKQRNVGAGIAYHWALTFVWDDGYRASYEAMDENGTLTAYWKQGEVDEMSDDGDEYMWCHGKSYIANMCSPVKVNSKAKSLRVGDMKYNVLSNNCQAWAKALARRFGVKLKESVKGSVISINFGSCPSDEEFNNTDDYKFGMYNRKVGELIGRLLTNN
ncbi:unnamed protein product [Meganyctiphanes norvegica]|uniref:Uncharacterized protein n=1 Tax=Meganyctiphanes norvegica TaxID=48144 RepID=A0AAV2R9R1_MEGNR